MITTRKGGGGEQGGGVAGSRARGAAGSAATGRGGAQPRLDAGSPGGTVGHGAPGCWADLDTQLFASIRSRQLPAPVPPGANAEGTDVRKIDAFAHILPPSYARRLESIMSGGAVSDRILGYQPWIHEDPALIDLGSRWRAMDAFGGYGPGRDQSP